MYTIAKRFEFSASHRLENLPQSHKCHNLHGHNYVVEVILQSKSLNEFGFVVDYTELNELKNFLDTNYDHKHLNDIYKETPTTAENIAKTLYEWCKNRWPQTHKIRVSETAKTWAEYSKE